MKLYVDRIEETVAVCQTEDERTVEIQLSVLPSDLKEGNVLVYDENGEKVTLTHGSFGVYRESADRRDRHQEFFVKKITP